MDVALDQILACPRCHASLKAAAESLLCTDRDCGFKVAVADGIVNALEDGRASFFDSHFQVMMHGSDEPGPRSVFYTQQGEALRKSLAGARAILDVGCGPKLSYERPRDCLVIGIDPSYESLRQNGDVDVRLYGSATALPLPNRSLDAVVCFYSLHHIVGATITENQGLLSLAFQEFSRVVRSGGHILVFEVAPWPPAWLAQRAVWNVVRRVAPEATAMFFWRRNSLTRLAAGHVPQGTRLEYHSFKVSPWTCFPPIFALPGLRLPRLLYPFDICMYHWRLGSTDGPGRSGTRSA